MPVLAIILMLTTVEQFALDVYLPSLPAMTLYFGVDNSLLQMTLSLYLLGFALSPLFFGPMTDYYGRRKILLTGMSIFLVASLITSVTDSVNVLLLARLIQGLGSGAVVVANQAMVRDTFQGKALSRVASYMSITWSLIPIIAPAIGGYLQHFFGWRANFYAISFYGLLVTLSLWYFVPETMKNKPVPLQFKLILKRYAHFLSNKGFMIFVACTAITYAMTIAFNTAAPFLFQKGMGLSPVEFGWLALFVGMSYLLGTVLNTIALKHASITQILICGQMLMIFFGLIMLVLALFGHFSVLTVSLPAAGMIFAEGLVYPNAAALAFEPVRKHTGIASALYSSIQLLACALTSALMARFPEATQMPLVCVMLGLAILLSVLYALAQK